MVKSCCRGKVLCGKRAGVDMEYQGMVYKTKYCDNSYLEVSEEGQGKGQSEVRGDMPARESVCVA